MGISSKEIFLLFISLMSAGIFSIFLPRFLDWKNLEIRDVFIFLIVIVIVFTWLIYTKIREVNDDLEQQKLEIKKLNERLKISNQLIDIKADIKELQRKY